METETASPAVTRDGKTILSRYLTNICKTLETDAPAASLQAGEIFTTVPGQQQAILLFACAYRVMKELNGAQEVLQMLADANPLLASIQFELALVHTRLGNRAEAIACLRRVVESEPNHPTAWRALGNLHSLEGDTARAAEAYTRHHWVSLREIRLLEGAIAESGNELAKAENMLLQCLAMNPTDVSYMHLLAEVNIRQSKYGSARELLERALDLVPDYFAARHAYGILLNHEYQWRDAITQFDIVLKARPDAAQAEISKAWSVVMMGEYDQAQRLFDSARPRLGSEVSYWVHYGHYLRTVARSREAVDAYRHAIELDPSAGLAWWSLANMKTYRFSPDEIEVMRAQLALGKLEDEQRSHLEFALGTALEAEKAYADSFEHYRQGNSIRHGRMQYDPTEINTRVDQIKALFTPELFRSRASSGSQATDPIFIVGMPRSGSTLIEQILSSHTLVEGTAELPDLHNIASDLNNRSDAGYLDILKELDDAELKTLGEKYLETTRHQRKLDRPYFADKSLPNFLLVGLIQLILPNAKIIDARRHPMSCCFSGYKQCFAAGSMPHSYDLSEVGAYYRSYVELMAHFDAVLPGRVHRVFHEDMVRNPEAEIRRLLEYCNLPFEEQCLRFHETDRGVRTSSSEQVRRPIYAQPVEPWRHYEEWLGSLKDALGEVLEVYPLVPKFV